VNIVYAQVQFGHSISVTYALLTLNGVMVDIPAVLVVS